MSTLIVPGVTKSTTRVFIVAAAVTQTVEDVRIVTNINATFQNQNGVGVALGDYAKIKEMTAARFGVPDTDVCILNIFEVKP